MKTKMKYMVKRKWITVVSLFFILCSSFVFCKTDKPTIYLIGDSTVHNTNNEQWGWGSLLPGFFDLTKINISNNAMAGRSTRTFIKEGRWDRVLSKLKAGDFVMMQFGHNEGSKPDTTRGGYRGVLRGTGDDSVTLIWPDGKQEIVHSYGWYIKSLLGIQKIKVPLR